MSEPLNVTVAWQEFGYVAKTTLPDRTELKSLHCNGQCQAVDEIARKIGPNAKVKFKASGWYQIEMREPKVTKSQLP